MNASVEICLPIPSTRLSCLQNESQICSVNATATYKNLVETGPVTQAEIFASEEAFLKSKNFGTPESFAPVRLLIDTGSNISGLDQSVIRILQLTSLNNGEEWVRSHVQNWQVQRYNCVLYLPIFNTQALRVEVLGGHFKESGYDGVLGRDVLRFCEFKYDGINNSFSLTARDL
jgi:hypothetical protein